MAQGFPFRTQAQAQPFFVPQPAAANGVGSFPAMNQPQHPLQQPMQAQPQPQQQASQSMQGQPVNGMTPPQGVNAGMPMPQGMPNGLPGVPADQQAQVQQMLNDPNMMDAFQKQVESVAGNDPNQQMKYMMDMMQDPSKADAFIRDMQAQGLPVPGMPQGAQGIPAGMSPAQAGLDPNAPAVPEMPEGFLEPDDMIKGAAVGVPLALGLKELDQRGVIRNGAQKLDNLGPIKQFNTALNTNVEKAIKGFETKYGHKYPDAVKRFKIWAGQVDPKDVKAFNYKGVHEALQKKLVVPQGRLDKMIGKIFKNPGLSQSQFDEVVKKLKLNSLDDIAKLEKHVVDDALKSVLGADSKALKSARKSFDAAKKYSTKQLGMVEHYTHRQAVQGTKLGVGRSFSNFFDNIKTIFTGEGTVAKTQAMAESSDKMSRSLSGAHAHFAKASKEAAAFSPEKLNAQAAEKTLKALDSKLSAVSGNLKGIQSKLSKEAASALQAIDKASPESVKQVLKDATKTLSKEETKAVRSAVGLMAEKATLEAVAKSAPDALKAHAQVVKESGRYSLKAARSFVQKEVTVHGSKMGAFKKNAGKLFGPVMAGALVVGFAFNAAKKTEDKQEKKKIFFDNLLGEGMGLFFGWQVVERLRNLNVFTKLTRGAAMTRFARMGSVAGLVGGIGAMMVLSLPFKKVGEKISHMIFGKPNKEVLEEKEKAGIKVYSPENFPPGASNGTSTQQQNPQQNPQAQGLDRSGSKYSDMFSRTTPAVDESATNVKLDDPNAPSDMPFSDGLVYTPEEIAQNKSRQIQDADNKHALADLNQAWDMSGMADLIGQ